MEMDERWGRKGGREELGELGRGEMWEGNWGGMEGETEEENGYKCQFRVSS
jgi:hypothetical protein